MDNFLESRLGRFTASEIWKLLKTGKAKDEMFGEMAKTYIDEKIAEAITGQKKAQIGSAATSWGLDKEKDAILWFEHITGKKVKQFGAEEYKFFPYDNNSGCSPDGLLLNENANIQVKCPFNSGNHIQYLLVNDEDASLWLKKNQFEYYAQCQFEMMCCKTEMCYFVSYDDRVVEPQHRMKIIKLSPDLEMQSDIDLRIKHASDLVRNALDKLYNIQLITVHEIINETKITVYDKLEG